MTTRRMHVTWSRKWKTWHVKDSAGNHWGTFTDHRRAMNYATQIAATFEKR